MSNPTAALQFPDTRWSIIQRVQSAPTEVRAEALNDLCRIYWPAVYSFARFRRNAPAEAEDLTQGFFARLLDRDSFGELKPERGKLRTWLIRSFENYCINQHHQAQAQRRGGGWIQVEITSDAGEEIWSRFALRDASEDPSQNLDRIWALTVLARALNDVGRAYEERGRGELFRALKPFAELAGDEPPYPEIAAELDLTPEAARKAVQRLRIAYGKAVRAQIEQTVDEAGDVDAEFDALLDALR